MNRDVSSFKDASDVFFIEAHLVTPGGESTDDGFDVGIVGRLPPNLVKYLSRFWLLSKRADNRCSSLAGGDECSTRVPRPDIGIDFIEVDVFVLEDGTPEVIRERRVGATLCEVSESLDKILLVDGDLSHDFNVCG